MNKGKNKLSLILILAIIFVIVALFINRKKVEAPVTDNKSSTDQLATTSINQISERKPTTTPDSKFQIPDSLLLPVPFTPQAPTANWDELHNEACEEASAIMAAEYFASSTMTTLPAAVVETEISRLTEWQDRQFGYHLDTTSAETAQMMEQVYSLNTKLIYNFTENDIKKELAQGRLVVISENGRLLNNPNYKRPGPIHHMLLIKGYDEKQFITNDSGTRKGLDYKYDFQTLYGAAADWRHDTNTTDTSIKTAIVAWK